MKIKYGQRIYIYLILVFTLFSVSLVLLFINREKELKRDITKAKQVIYADLVSDYLIGQSSFDGDFCVVDSILSIFPRDIRISIFDNDGSVVYDNVAPEEEWEAMKSRNNIGVVRAILYGSGNYIRKDRYHDNRDYYFYATYKNNYVIRIGLPYVPFELFQKSDVILLGISIAIFICALVLISLLYFSTRQSLRKLKLFISSFTRDNKSPKFESFRDHELSEIQSMIADIYKQFELKERDTQVERDKLLEHFNFAEEGISFFTAENENIYTNVHFIQYLSILMNEMTFEVQQIFENPLFTDVRYFLSNRGTAKSYSSKLHGNGKIFGIHVIVFDDESYEIIIRPISEAERDEMDAAAITNNIAHELRTPVTSMRGYLETILEHENITPEKKKEFLERAYKQCIRLNEIIQDVILLSKTTYAPQFFLIEKIDLNKLISEMIDDFSDKIETNETIIDIRIPENTEIKGNRTLLSCIFRNLAMNSLKYSGIGSTVTINNYRIDNNYLYFSFSDNGNGVDKKHIDHLFDRFYRVSDGRTRDTGGSGLGLSIVKEAVHFHHGEIYVKNRTEGGLEYLFTLSRN